MTLEELALLAEVVGAVAILVTLIYLAIQVKDGARAYRAASVTDATTGMQGFYQELGANSEASDLFLKGLRDPESLSIERQYQFIMLTHSAFIGFQRGYFLAQEGTLDEELRDSIGSAVQAVNHLPGVRVYWRQRKSFFQPEFIAWVEELLERPNTADMDAYGTE